MSKVYIATMHTGNTLTIHGRSFFKDRPTIVDDSQLIEYLKNHPNFKMEVREVKDDATSSDVITAAKEQLNKANTASTEAVKEDKTETETSNDPTTPRAPARKGSVVTSKPITKQN